MANGASSRHSGVLHSGVYYPADSLKTRLCLRGKSMLYNLLKEKNLPYNQCGKVILSNKSAGCLEKLQSIKDHADNVGVTDLRYLSRKELEEKLPFLNQEGYVGAAVFSPSSGIFDSSALIRYLEATILNSHGLVRLSNSVESIQAIDLGRGGYQIKIFDEKTRQRYNMVSDIVVNAAGLYADDVYSMIEQEKSKLDYRRIHPRRGHYYKLYLPNKILKQKLQTLVFPVPDKNFKGTSLQMTMDMSGNIRVGPDAEYISSKDDYMFDGTTERFTKFWSAISKYMDFSSLEGLSMEEKQQIVKPDFVGISGKLLSKDRKAFRDFIIEPAPGLSGFINCIGINSPGLTACLSIAEHVEDIIRCK